MQEDSVTVERTIRAESAAHRLAFVALLGALREIHGLMIDKVVFQDKHILNQGMGAINRMFRQFDKNGLGDNRYYDDLVADHIAVSGKQVELLINILKERYNDVQEG
jgi:hypothetical protein